MELEDVLVRIESRLQAVGLSAHAASLAAKRPDAIRNLKRAVKNHDRRGVTTETLTALAPVLKTTAAWLLEGVGEPAPCNVVPVVGRVGAGGEIQPDFQELPPDGLYDIEVPFQMPEEAIAFEIEGESLWPRYDSGDMVICWRGGARADEAVGFEAALKTADGKWFLKRVQRGAADGTYDLESHNAAPVRGARVEWASVVKGVVRTGQWHRIQIE